MIKSYKVWGYRAGAAGIIMEGFIVNDRTRRLLISTTIAVSAVIALSGCGRLRGQTATVETAQLETQAETIPVVRVTETEKESEKPKLITSVEYTSKDGTVKITLPDNTWKVTQDADEMRVFASGDDAMINITHASTESAMKTLSIQTSKESLESTLTKQYTDKDAYDITDFTNQTVGNVNTYRYVVKYNAAARMWAYSVTYGIVAQNQAYVITGTVTDDNPTLLKAVEDSVDSFTILKDEDLIAVTADNNKTQTAQTEQAQKATEQTAAAGTTLYASDIVNVRSGPGTDSDIIGAYSAGDKVTVTGEENGWYKVSVNGTTGYIRKDLLTSTQPATSTTAETTAPASDGTASDGSDAASSAEVATATDYGTASTLYATDGVNVRSNPSTSASVSGSLTAGSAVTVIGETDNWFIVSTGTGKGYVSKSYLTSTQPSGSSSSGSSSSGGSSSGSSSSGSSSSGSSSTLSGTVTSSSSTALTLQGDDGNTYTIYTGDADIYSASGISSGQRVTVSIDNSQTSSDGTRYATSVSG